MTLSKPEYVLILWFSHVAYRFSCFLSTYAIAFRKKSFFLKSSGIYAHTSFRDFSNRYNELQSFLMIWATIFCDTIFCILQHLTYSDPLFILAKHEFCLQIAFRYLYWLWSNERKLEIFPRSRIFASWETKYNEWGNSLLLFHNFFTHIFFMLFQNLKDS